MTTKLNHCFSILVVAGALFALGCDVLNAKADERADTYSDDATNSHLTMSSNQPRRAKGVSPDPASSRTVDAIALTSETFTSTLEVSGKALAKRESYLSFSVPGLVRKIHVARGDRVKKGQILARLDGSSFQIGVQQAQAALDGANAATDQLETEIARVDQLLAEGAAPTAAKDDLLAKDKGARAQTRMATAALNQARKALRDAVLRAPYGGVITEILKEKGEQAPAMPPTMIMKIVDASELEVQVFVPEASSRFIQVGTEAEVVVDSADTVARGEAVFVSNAIQPGARTFEVRIRIDNPEGRIKAGSFARVRLTQESRDDAILIPVSSLSRDEQEMPFVFIAEKGKARRVPIDLGATQGARVEVTKGLKAGQKLITTELANLTDGQPVTVTP